MHAAELGAHPPEWSFGTVSFGGETIFIRNIVSGEGYYSTPRERLFKMANSVTSEPDANSVAAAILYREARLLDRGEGPSGSQCIGEDAVTGCRPGSTNIRRPAIRRLRFSLVYHDARRGLEERYRAHRIPQIDSPRCRCRVRWHQISNRRRKRQRPCISPATRCFRSTSTIRASPKNMSGTGAITTRWSARTKSGKSHAKIITLVNDCVPTLLDFYSV